MERKPTTMPKFMVLLYSDQTMYTRMSPDELQKASEKYIAWRKAPFSVDGGRLENDKGKVLRAANGGGKPTAVDGPFTEAKEILGGYYTIEAPDYDEAVKITLTNPHLEYGGTIQIRQVYGS
jgi:hypothetical protein